ncbi:CD166 antigen homolog [Alosa sapidissima]|uniref:CD166 antigen homolog n=1 Tax=Alosa sapidissima TaxID=34773 RepID=UPI001C086CF5|nr:CD166 antigen homolog [Alosa sapidissima]
MHSASILAGVFLSLLHQVCPQEIITSQYGETIRIPCGPQDSRSEEPFLIKWKYEDKVDGTSGDLLVKRKTNATITASDEFKGRVSIGKDDSLLITNAVLSDQKTYTCMMVMISDISEHSMQVLIRKSPERVELTNNPAAVETGKRTTIGECSADDANPAAKLTWYRNDKPLEHDGKGIVITVSETVDASTGLTSSVSELQYSVEKEDMGALFSCGVQDSALRSKAVNFTINYPTEKVSLEVVTPGLLLEGADVMLRCRADGNPPPSSYVFYLQGKEVTVEDQNSYTLTGVTRDQSGEYKCSPSGDTSLVASHNITIHYLDVALSPSGKLVKAAGEPLPITLEKDASGKVTVAWTKNNASLTEEPQFERLKYSDSGLYECKVSMGDLVSTHSFELLVEGAPVITSLKEELSADGAHKVLSCEAEGFPKPTVEWSGINGTNVEESDYVDGRVTHQLTVVPRANLTVTCLVMNNLGMDSKTTEVSSLLVSHIDDTEVKRMDKQDQTEESGDPAKLAVGIVLGLILVTLALGLGYWFYIKKSKQGSWKTGEKEAGNTEESKKLEEVPQKAEV